MVKGLARRIVVVKPSGSPLFEQAIFIMRDGAKDIDEDTLVKQACSCAEDYVRKKCGKSKRPALPAPAIAAAGAAATGVAWLFTLLK